MANNSMSLILQGVKFLQGDIYEKTEYKKGGKPNHWAWFALTKGQEFYDINLSKIQNVIKQIKNINSISDEKYKRYNHSVNTGEQAFERQEFKQKEGSNATKEEVYGFYKTIDYVIRTGTNYDITLLEPSKIENPKGENKGGEYKIVSGSVVDLIATVKWVEELNTGIKFYLSGIRFREKGEPYMTLGLDINKMISQLDDIIPDLDEGEGSIV